MIGQIVNAAGRLKNLPVGFLLPGGRQSKVRDCSAEETENDDIYEDNNGASNSEKTNKASVAPLIQKNKERQLRNEAELGEIVVPGLRVILPEDEMIGVNPAWPGSLELKKRLAAILQRRNDREEIRRRLAMGSDTDEYYGGERITRKPSLQTRLQSGMNLQICFMNETANDPEQTNLDPESDDSQKIKKRSANQDTLTNNAKNSELSNSAVSNTSSTTADCDASLSSTAKQANVPEEEMDFVMRQAKLQLEARMALAQAKEMAHMQMEVEKQRKKKSPIAEMVGLAFPDSRRRASRQVLNEMNVAQLQVIVNDLHTQIETLNEELVRLLLERDDLHMEQDSMLVDIEDLTRYLGAKDQAVKESQTKSTCKVSSSSPMPMLKLKLKK